MLPCTLSMSTCMVRLGYEDTTEGIGRSESKKNFSSSHHRHVNLCAEFSNIVLKDLVINRTFWYSLASRKLESLSTLLCLFETYNAFWRYGKLCQDEMGSQILLWLFSYTLLLEVRKTLPVLTSPLYTVTDLCEHTHEQCTASNRSNGAKLTLRKSIPSFWISCHRQHVSDDRICSSRLFFQSHLINEFYKVNQTWLPLMFFGSVRTHERISMNFVLMADLLSNVVQKDGVDRKLVLELEFDVLNECSMEVDLQHRLL
ncbi:hypothetical protein Tco_0887796 [Tanacetum coccineum]